MIIDKDKFKNSSQNQKDLLGNLSKISISDISSSEDKIFSKTGKFIKIIDDLKECSVLPIDYNLKLPRICVVGLASSGKSSIINSLCGVDLLPRGENIITRRPIELKMNHISGVNKIRPYCELYLDGYTNAGRYEDISQANKKLGEHFKSLSQNEKEKYSKDPIKIQFYSNNCLDITYIDLPGLSETQKITKEITHNYIKDDMTYILYALNVGEETFQQTLISDLSKDKILRFIKEVDEDFRRTIGVFTKIDNVNSPNSSEIFQCLKKYLNELDNDESNNLPRNGFLAVKNPSSIESTNSFADNLHIEREFFRSHNSFKFVPSQNLSIEALSEKLKKLFYDDKTIKKIIIDVHHELNTSTQKCQKEISKFGLDYLIYTSESKHSYIASLINIFSDTLEKIFSSKMSQLEENLMNHKLKEMYSDFLKSFMSDYDASSKLKNEEIIRILKLTEGINLSGFPEADVIHSLLQDEVEILREELKNYLDKVNDLVTNVIKNTTFKIFCRFPKLMDKIEELMNLFCDEHFKKTTYLIESVSEMNFNYLYLDEKCLSYKQLLDRFVISNDVGEPGHGRDLSNTQSNIKRHESIREQYFHNAKDSDRYYNGLAEYIKILINHFYSLIIRNLREYVPKATGKYFLNVLKENTRFYLLKELTSDILSYESYLEEDSEVMEKRNFYLNMMKILKNCDKMLLYDEDIRFAIKGDKKSINKILEKNLKMNSENISTTSTTQENIGTNVNIQSNKEPRINQEIQKNPISTNANSQNNTKRFFTDEAEVNNSNAPIKSNISSTNNSSYSNNNSNNNNINIKQTNTSVNNNFINNVNNSNQPKPSSTTTIPPVTRNEYNSENSEKIEKSATNKEGGNISIKFDPSGDIKDAKVKVDMDAETAWNFYQNNKKYLPTTQQVISGAKATANFVEKTGNKLSEYDSNERINTQSEKETLVTGNKMAQPKKMTDPLTMANLFGIKKDTSQNASNKSIISEKPAKKGFF